MFGLVSEAAHGPAGFFFFFFFEESPIMRNKELLSSFEQIPFGSFQKHQPGLVFLSHSEVPGAQALEAFLAERQGGFGSGVAVRPASRVCGVGRPCHQRRADPGPWPGRLMPGWTAAPAGVPMPAVRGRVENPRSGTPAHGPGGASCVVLARAPSGGAGQASSCLVLAACVPVRPAAPASGWTPLLQEPPHTPLVAFLSWIQARALGAVMQCDTPPQQRS